MRKYKKEVQSDPHNNYHEGHLESSEHGSIISVTDLQTLSCLVSF